MDGNIVRHNDYMEEKTGKGDTRPRKQFMHQVAQEIEVGS